MAVYQMILAAAFLATSMAIYLQVFGRRRVPSTYVVAFYLFGAGFGLAALQFWPHTLNLVALAIGGVIAGEIFVFVSILYEHEVPFPPRRLPKAADPYAAADEDEAENDDTTDEDADADADAVDLPTDPDHE